MPYCVVSAFYSIPGNKKRSAEDYKVWLTNFFECVTCPVIFFCEQAIADRFQRPNVQFIVRPFQSFEMMSPERMARWREFHAQDSENELHSPEHYAIWAAKQEFVHLAIRPEFDTYLWCDAGCFRYKWQGSFQYLPRYIQPGKMTCLFMPEHSMVGGTLLAGDAAAWGWFRAQYLAELDREVHGKDQVVFARFINPANSVIIAPTPLPVPSYDQWFHLIYLFNY